MSKQAYREIIISGAVLVLALFFTSAISTAAEQADEVENITKQIGKDNPFKVVDFSEIVQEDLIKSLEGTGVTRAQLQSAIQAAIQASGGLKSQSVAANTELVEIIPERNIKSVMLKFLRAANALPVVTKMLTINGTASTDEETNTLIICDAKENLDKIITEITKADQTPQQVLIEVVIVDVQLSNDTELGVNWDNLFQLGDSFLGSVSYTQQLNDLTTGGSLTLIKGRLENTIKALQKDRNTEILASPRVLVLSGQEAKLETIEEIPYTDLTQTGSGGGVDNPIASTSFKNAGITLTVKPTVTDEGKIMIEVQPDQSINTGIAGVGNTNVPIIDRRTIKTTLLLEAGDIAVIGGLRSKDVRVTQDKIPLLGDIPFIGGLFSNDKEVVENSELLILISPHLYRASEGLKEREKALWMEVNDLKPVRLKKKIRPEHELVSEVVPQNKPKEK